MLYVLDVFHMMIIYLFIYCLLLGLQYHVIMVEDVYGLPLKEKLLPQYLKELGYKTHLVGKWHLGHYKMEYLPLSRG